MSATVTVQVRADHRYDAVEGGMTVADVRTWLARWDQLAAGRADEVDGAVVTCRANANSEVLALYATLPAEPGHGAG